METTEQINVKTRTSYQGKNQETLTVESNEKNYKSQLWGTFDQWTKLGRKVTKGQKGVSIFHPATRHSGKMDKDGKEIVMNVRKYWRIFNEEQTDKIKSGNVNQIT